MDFNLENISYREGVVSEDKEAVRWILESSGFFYPDEIETAIELIEERLAKGTRSGYYFLFAQQGERVIGYTCFGPIPCTRVSYDLYWIAVHQGLRGLNIGKSLLAKTEQLIAQMGGERIYIETSSRKLYDPTRSFYHRCGYREEAILKDFYAQSDDKVIYLKKIAMA